MLAHVSSFPEKTNTKVKGQRQKRTARIGICKDQRATSLQNFPRVRLCAKSHPRSTSMDQSKRLDADSRSGTLNSFVTYVNVDSDVIPQEIIKADTRMQSTSESYPFDLGDDNEDEAWRHMKSMLKQTRSQTSSSFSSESDDDNSLESAASGCSFNADDIYRELIKEHHDDAQSDKLQSARVHKRKRTKEKQSHEKSNVRNTDGLVVSTQEFEEEDKWQEDLQTIDTWQQELQNVSKKDQDIVRNLQKIVLSFCYEAIVDKRYDRWARTPKRWKNRLVKTSCSIRARSSSSSGSTNEILLKHKLLNLIANQPRRRQRKRKRHRKKKKKNKKTNGPTLPPCTKSEYSSPSSCNTDEESNLLDKSLACMKTRESETVIREVDAENRHEKCQPSSISEVQLVKRETETRKGTPFTFDSDSSQNTTQRVSNKKSTQHKGSLNCYRSPLSSNIENSNRRVVKHHVDQVQPRHIPPMQPKQTPRKIGPLLDKSSSITQHKKQKARKNTIDELPKYSLKPFHRQSRYDSAWLRPLASCPTFSTQPTASRVYSGKSCPATEVVLPHNYTDKNLPNVLLGSKMDQQLKKSRNIESQKVQFYALHNLLSNLTRSQKACTQDQERRNTKSVAKKHQTSVSPSHRSEKKSSNSTLPYSSTYSLPCVK